MHQVADMPGFSAANVIELLIINFLSTASPDDEIIKAFQATNAELQASLSTAIAKVANNL